MTFLPRGKPFSAGHDSRRNPGGRTMDGKTKTGETLLEVLRAEIPHQELAQAARELLEARDPRTVHYLIDRELGRPAQAVHITGDAEKPLHMLVGVEGRNLAPEQQITGPEQGVIEGAAEASEDGGTAPNHQADAVPDGWGDGAVVNLEEGS